MANSRKSYCGYVYLIGSKRFGWYKIGKSRTAKVRLETIGILLPFKVDIYALWMCELPTLLESAMHKKYAKYHINGEWFSFDCQTLKQIVDDETPLPSVLVSPDINNLCGFTNLHDDVVIDGLAESKKMKSLAFMKSVKVYLDVNHLEPTPENKKIAKKAVSRGLKNALESITSE